MYICIRSITSCVCLFVTFLYINVCDILLEDSNFLEVDKAMGRWPSRRPIMLWHSDIYCLLPEFCSASLLQQVAPMRARTFQCKKLSRIQFGRI